MDPRRGAGLVSPSTASSYGSYWKKAEAQRNQDDVRDRAQHREGPPQLPRRTERGEKLVAAMRFLSKHLVNDGSLSSAS
jgi:hypothetical protein